MRVALFYQDEVLLSSDLQQGFQQVSDDVAKLITELLYPNASWLVLSGFSASANTPNDNGIKIAAGVAIQNGYVINQSGFQVNILPGTYPYGSGLAANATYPRWDTVAIAYTTQATNIQSRTFDPPATSPQNVAVTQVDSFSIQVVHGTASSNPTQPPPPSGYNVLAYVYVPAGATTIAAANVYDQSKANMLSGGRLGLSSGGILWRNDSNTTNPELDTASGILLKLGTSGAQILDNTAAGYLDITGNSTSGVRFNSPALFNYGVQIPSGQTISGAGSLNLGGSGTFGGLLTASGGLDAAGAYTITSPPPITSNNVGWKIGLFTDTYWLGVANYTISLLTQGWLSVFNTPPANNASTTSPDSNAKVSLGTNGSVIATGPIVAGGGTLNLSGSGAGNAPPDVHTDGASLYLEAASAPVYLRPIGGTNNYALSITQTGSVQTHNSTGAAQNILDDGTGLFSVRKQISGQPGASLILQQLGLPSGLTATVGTSGTVGSYLAANTTYYYTVTAVAPDGSETNAPAAVSAAEGATPYPITISWTGSTNAASYNVYKGASASAVNFLANVTGTSYTDTGNTATTSQVPPLYNHTANFTPAAVGDTPVVGHYGVAATVEAPYEVQLTTTSATTVASFAPPVSGVYRISVYWRVVTATTTVTIYVSYDDAGGAQTYYFVNGASLTVGSYESNVTLECTTASYITVVATAGTANQVFVSATIEGVA